MTVAADPAPGEVRPREVLMRVRLGLPAVQVLVAAAAVVATWAALTRESVSSAVVLFALDDRLAAETAAVEASTGAGAALWATVIGGALVLALSAWTGWGLLGLTWRSSTRWPNLVAVLAEARTWVVLASLLLTVPLLLLLELPTT